MSAPSRVAWITGASSGIGNALAVSFAAKGDIVIASARTTSKLQELEGRIAAAHGVCTALACDVRNKDAVARTVRKIMDTHGRIDILINNAGVTYFKDFLDTTEEEFNEVVDTNLRGVFLTTKNVLPSMLREHHGRVINILSYAVKEVYTKSAAYAASKAGVEAMMNVLRAEVRRQGIHVVNVYPGAVSTPIWPPGQREEFGTQMLKPDEIADMIYEISRQPRSLTVEEIVLRPRGGDLRR